jgi:antitoxin (DNA-binding transcriptional repressor) of toxin-antitoxin stability system
MTKTVNINEDISIETVIALIENGDEVVIEKNGEPLAKVTPIEKPKELKRRVAGLGKGEVLYMSEDFDDELPDEFWGFDKDL